MADQRAQSPRYHPADDLHALSKFFGYATKQRWANHNPVKDVDIPSDAEAIRMHILSTKEEQDYFTRAAKWPDLHDVGRLILNQGMRPEEVTTLRKADVDLDHGQVHIRQGKSPAARRTLDLTSESKVILGRRMAVHRSGFFPLSAIPASRSDGPMDSTTRFAPRLCGRA